MTVVIPPTAQVDAPPAAPPVSAFAKYAQQAWPHEYRGSLHLYRVCGGIPADPNIVENWLAAKMGAQSEALLAAQVAEVVLELKISPEEAAKIVKDTRHLNQFKRDEARGLYLEGRQLKAAIKEAVSVAVAAGKLKKGGYGVTKKGLHAFVAEHVCVVEERLYLGKQKADGTNTRFPHTWHGAGIVVEEYVDEVDVDFTVTTDYVFSEAEWAMIWLTGEQQGLGATRSMGFGRYVVTRWDKVR